MIRPRRATAKAALKADAASDRLDAWLQQQRGSRSGKRGDASGLDGSAPAEGMAGAFGKQAAAVEAEWETHGSPRPAIQSQDLAQPSVPQRLPHTDWLHHRLAVTGPADALADFQVAASGAGTIPWPLQSGRMAEDLFHLLVAPAAPQRRRLSLAGARALADQLRAAVELRHAAACVRVGHSQACPLDLHALLPVPPDILRLGADHPHAVAWLWAYWGTTASLRHVTVEPAPALRTPLPDGTATVRLSFWSADWTPWRALASMRVRWPVLRFDVRPTYYPL